MGQDKNTPTTDKLQRKIIGLAKVHYLFVGFLAAQTIIFDAWSLVTPQIILNRWIGIAALFVIVTVVWYIAGNKQASTAKLNASAWTIAVADILFASYFIFLQRGVASNAVLFFALAIISIGVLQNRRALMAAASLSAAGYSIASISYFVLNFNEAFKVELYGQVTFYVAVMFVVAKLVDVVSTSRST